MKKKEKIPNLEELKSGSFRYRKMIDGQMIRITFDHYPTKKELTLAVTMEMSQIGERVPKNSFGKLAKEYIEIKRPVLSPSTIRGYNAQIKQMSDTLKKTDINRITQALIQTEIGAFSKKHSPKSTANFHGFISAVLKMYRPQFRLDTTLPQRIRFDPITPEAADLEKLLEAVKESKRCRKYSVPFQLGILGLRRSEICALESGDLDGNYLTINKAKVKTDDNRWIVKNLTKTTEGKRTIYIPDSLRDEILEDGMYQGAPCCLLKNLRRFQRRLGLPEFRFHDLRAFYCSYAHSKGIPDAVIMSTGGWQSEYCMKRVYRRALEDDARKCQKEIAESLFSERKKA